MSEKFWRPFGHFANVLSVSQTLLGWAALWTAAAALMTWAASTIGPILALGWGAVVITGFGLACILVLVMSVGLIAWRYFKPISPAPSAPSCLPDEQIRIDQSLYVGRVVADAQKLLSDLYLEFQVVAFNGASVELTLEGVRGFISFGTKIPTPPADLVRLPAPTVRDDNPLRFAPFSEFMITVSQRLSGAVAAEIDRLLSAGEQVEFSFEALAIEVRDGEDGQKVRIPFGPSWEWTILQREKEAILLKRQIRLGISDVLGGNAKAKAG
jgi:hypothetical protein